VRLVDMEGKDRTVTIECFRNLEQAIRTSLIEEPIEPATVLGNSARVRLGHHAIETFKIR